MGLETTRLNWVRARSLTKDKYEKLLISLRIARYDYIFAKHYGNKSGVKISKKQTAELNRRLKNKKLDDEIKAIQTLRKNERKQIEYDKKLGCTFSTEKRNGKEYLYKQKRIGGKKEHTYLAKNWQDLDTKQSLQAQKQVWQDKWALKDLAPSERETFSIIETEAEYINNDPDPILEKAKKQLGMKCSYTKNRKFIITHIKPLPVQEVKNILNATRKALLRRGNIDKKIESMARRMSEGQETPENLEKFIISVIRDSGALKGIRLGGRKVGPIKVIEDYINGLILRNPKSMYSVLEPIEVKIFAENVVNRFQKLGGHFSY